MSGGSLESRLRKLEGGQGGQRPGRTLPNLPHAIPDIIEFTMTDQFLGQPLFPRQGTLLKVIFCEERLLTSFDHEVIAEWSSGFKDTVRDDGTRAFQGSEGIVPDVLE